MKEACQTAYHHLWELVEKKKLVRRICLFWFLALVAFATIKIFSHMEMVDGSVAAIYGTLCALNGVIFGFYSRDRKNERGE